MFEAREAISSMMVNTYVSNSSAPTDLSYLSHSFLTFSSVLSTHPAIWSSLSSNLSLTSSILQFKCYLFQEISSTNCWKNNNVVMICDLRTTVEVQFFTQMKREGSVSPTTNNIEISYHSYTSTVNVTHSVGSAPICATLCWQRLSSIVQRLCQRSFITYTFFCAMLATCTSLINNSVSRF